MSDTVDLANPTDPKLRALWGDVRAKLGCDPRFEPDGLRLAKKDVEDPPTSFTTKGDEVPGFALIDARNKSFWFGDGGSNSGPPVRVPGLDKPFYIARTLTTVAQYAQFVASSDYVSHFVGEGLKWLDGSYQGPVTDDDLKNWLARRSDGQRIEPYEWKDQLRNHLRPIVDVSWFEAQAYVHWLNASLALNGLGRYSASLPTELQWECAARFAANVVPGLPSFPWKDGTDDPNGDAEGFALHANVGALVGSRTTVGLYPEGCSDTGVADMAGNVWEWIEHGYVENYDPLVALAQQTVTKYYTMRGGSWVTDPISARCSFRRAYHPDGWNNGVGFRVALSLVN